MSGLENSPYKDFINSLDLKDFTGKKDLQSAPEGAVSNAQLISTENDNVFHYEVAIGLARFDTAIDTSLKDPSVLMWFPSHITSFDSRDMLRVVSSVFSAAHPGRNYTPRAVLTRGMLESCLDLRNYWEGKLYESSLQEPIDSVSYCIPEGDFPGGKAARQFRGHDVLPPFMYGFKRLGENDMLEFIRMSPMKSTYIEPELAQQLLARNKGYLGRDIVSDALDLKKTLNRLGKQHPQEKIFPGM